MANIAQFDVEVRNISNLPDEPISPEYTAAEFKAEFDQAAVDIKDYINTTLCSYVNTLRNDVDAIVEVSIPDGSVTTAKLADDAVTALKISDGAVDSSALGNSAVTSAKLADGAVTASKIQNDAVTAGKLADDAVTTNAIAALAVTDAKVNDVAATKITGLLAEVKTEATADTSDYTFRIIAYGSSAPSGTANNGDIYIQLIEE